MYLLINTNNNINKFLIWLIIESINHNVKLKILTIKITKFNDENENLTNFTLNFENVFNYSFYSCKMYDGMYNNEIFGWEEIPNNLINDNYIEETKNDFISNGGEWNDNLFAIRLLLSNLSEIKIICESIIAE